MEISGKRRQQYVRYKKKWFTIANVLFVLGGVILSLSLILAIFLFLSYANSNEVLFATGLLLGTGTLLCGAFLSSLALGLSRVIEQNEKLIRLMEIDQYLKSTEDHWGD